MDTITQMMKTSANNAEATKMSRLDAIDDEEEIFIRYQPFMIKRVIKWRRN